MSRQWTACFRSALWIGSFISLIGLMNLSSHGEQTDGDADDSRDQLVLLTTGRMLTGRVTRNGGGYLVEQSNGRIQVAAEDVKFVVNDLREAYRKQRDSIVEPTPATHIALANWCISHRLHDEARDELKRCLKRDPENVEARRLLLRLTDTIRAGLPLRGDEVAPLKTQDGFVQPDVESLGGLSREAASQFTSRIQPLLLNKCGNASCHGMASSNTFKLTMSRGAGKGSRQNTERNLYETMRYVDLETVTNSRLLQVFQGSHGGKGTIFVGPAGAEQIKQIKAWVVSVVEEKQAEARKLEQRPRLATKVHSKYRVTQASAVVEKTSDSEGRGAPMKNDFEAPPLEPVVDKAKPRELKVDPTDAIELARERQDPFDPEVFNQRYRRP